MEPVKITMKLSTGRNENKMSRRPQLHQLGFNSRTMTQRTTGVSRQNRQRPLQKTNNINKVLKKKGKPLSLSNPRRSHPLVCLTTSLLSTMKVVVTPLVKIKKSAQSANREGRRRHSSSDRPTEPARPHLPLRLSLLQSLSLLKTSRLEMRLLWMALVKKTTMTTTSPQQQPHKITTTHHQRACGVDDDRADRPPTAPTQSSDLLPNDSLRFSKEAAATVSTVLVNTSSSIRPLSPGASSEARRVAPCIRRTRD